MFVVGAGLPSGDDPFKLADDFGLAGGDPDQSGSNLGHAGGDLFEPVGDVGGNFDDVGVHGRISSSRPNTTPNPAASDAKAVKAATAGNRVTTP